MNYLGSHDFVGNKDPMIRIISGYTSDEQEDSNVFRRVNPLEEENVDLKIPFRKIHNQFTHALTRLSYGILFTKPGGSLFYQGEEIAQDLNIQNEWAYVNALKDNRFPSKNVNINKYVGSHRMTWHYYDLISGKKDPLLNFITEDDQKLFSGHLNFFKQMIKFKKANPEINNQDAQNVRIDNNSKIVTYELSTPRDQFFIVGNFNNDLGGVWINFPGNDGIWWSEVMNSSDPQFGSDSDIYQNAISNLGGRKNMLRLKGPGFYIFKASRTPAVSKKLYFRSNVSNWLADESTELKQNPANMEELVAKVEFKKSEAIEFKVGTKSWSIDYGKSTDPKYFTYTPNSANIRVNMNAGKYNFKFNIKNYTYSFEKL